MNTADPAAAKDFTARRSLHNASELMVNDVWFVLLTAATFALVTLIAKLAEKL